MTSPRAAAIASIASIPSIARFCAAELAQALAPLACAACDERLPGRAVLCSACAHGVVRADEPGEGEAHAFAMYGGSIAEALRRLKYGGRPDLAGPLGHLLRGATRRARLQADLVVPVPLHAERLVERGYNQAALLAAQVAREIGAPLSARALVRTRATAQQATLPRVTRLQNLVGAFRVRVPMSVRSRRVLLVDDVATTGATLAACDLALREAGALSVERVVVARAG